MEVMQVIFKHKQLRLREDIKLQVRRDGLETELTLTTTSPLPGILKLKRFRHLLLREGARVSERRRYIQNGL